MGGATNETTIELEDGKQTVVQSFSLHGGDDRPSLDLRIGGTYLVSPKNPQKLKHRGRLCTYTGYHEADGWRDKLKVRFLDNGRPGRIDLDDLVVAP